jgi:hypothetical protein
MHMDRFSRQENVWICGDSIMKKYILVFLLLLLFITPASAAIITASSCSRDDVYTKYADANTKANDTIIIPATSGGCDWGTTYISVTAAKPVKFLGVGNGADTSSNTVITCSNATYGCFKVATGVDPNEYPLEIGNMRMIIINGTAIYMEGTGYGWRIHHNYIYHATPENLIGVSARIDLRTINTGGDYKLFGLIDSNTLYNIKIDPSGSGTDGGSGEMSWRADPQWGTDQALFIENNILYGPDKGHGLRVDSNGGARIVIRYNDFQDAYIMAHAPCEQTVRGARSYEIYNNKMSSTTTDTWAATMSLRAGSHVVTRNQILGLWDEGNNGNGAPAFDLRRLTESACGVAAWGMCDGTSDYDTNEGSGASAGYRCLDQVGSGKGAFGSQTLDPVYVWGNVGGQACVGGTNIYNVCTSNEDCPGSTCTSGTVPTPNTPVVRGGANHIVKNRDYYESARPDWAMYTCPHPLAGSGSCATTGDTQYGRAGYSLSGSNEEVAPTVTSVYVNGATMTINFSEPITSADNAAFTLDPSGADVTVDCPAVATAATSMACTISRALVQSETATYAYTDTKVVDTAGTPNALANIGATAITGNLTPAEAPTSKLTVSKTGSGCTVTSSPSGISLGGATASDDFEFNTGTAVTLSGWSENGWNAITYGGDCAANGTVTMNADKECTATCTQVQLFP